MAKKPAGQKAGEQPHGPSAADLVVKTARNALLSDRAHRLPLESSRVWRDDELDEMSDGEIPDALYLEDQLLEELGAPGSYRIGREKDRDLEFKGWRLGRGERIDAKNEAKTVVDLYLTTRQNFVAHVWRLAGQSIVFSHAGVVEGELTVEDDPELGKGIAVDGLDELLAWLKADANGALGPASKAAWEKLCTSFSWFAYEETEEV